MNLILISLFPEPLLSIATIIFTFFSYLFFNSAFNCRTFNIDFQRKSELPPESSKRKISKYPLDDEDEIPLIFVKKVVKKNSKIENNRTVSNLIRNKKEDENINEIENEDKDILNANKIIDGTIFGKSPVMPDANEEKKKKKHVQQLNLYFLDAAIEDAVSRR